MTARQKNALLRHGLMHLRQEIERLPEAQREHFLAVLEVNDAMRRGYSRDQACALLEASPEDLRSKRPHE